jgi:hypothetical protein
MSMHPVPGRHRLQPEYCSLSQATGVPMGTSVQLHHWNSTDSREQQVMREHVKVGLRSIAVIAVVVLSMLAIAQIEGAGTPHVVAHALH